MGFVTGKSIDSIILVIQGNLQGDLPGQFQFKLIKKSIQGQKCEKNIKNRISQRSVVAYVFFMSREGVQTSNR